MASRISRISTAFTLLLLISCSTSLFAQTASKDFENYAKDIAAKIAKQKKSSMFPRILVIDFSLTPVGMDSLGSYLADDLSGALSSLLPAGTIIPRQKLQEFLDSRGPARSDLEFDTVAFWAADKLDANEIILGKISSEDSKVSLQLRLLRIADAKEVANWSLDLPKTEELQLLAGKPIPPPQRAEFSNLPLRCSSDYKGQTKAFQAKGGTIPKGTRMPNPPYSDKARREKLSAQRQYDVYLDSQGQELLILPHYPLRPEFDDIAMETMRTWKFQPATLEGKPVPVCVVIEITWRLY